MSAKVFVDSNTLLYLYDHDAIDKQRHARAWLAALTDIQIATTNLQVLNEVTNIFLKRMKEWTPEYAFSMVDSLYRMGSNPLSEREVRQARTLRIRYRYSWWDCLLLASALELGCSHFLSEDLQDGQRIDLGLGKALTIVDPFAHSPDQILSSR